VTRLTPKPLNLSDCERLELQELVNRHNTPQQLALRAKIILLASDGKNHREIARTLDISRHTACLWRERWLSTCLSDLTVTQRLQDSERVGTPINFCRVLNYLSFNKILS
jgi:putative transposase